MPQGQGAPEPSEVQGEKGQGDQVSALRAEVQGRSHSDDLDTTFKRRVALAVSLLALIGGLMAFGAVDASINSALHDRTAKQLSVHAMSNQNAGAVQTYSELTTYVGASALKRRADLGKVQRELLGMQAGPISSAQWAAVSSRLSVFSPLLQPGTMSGRADLLLNEKLKASNLSALNQEAAEATADEWAKKADGYVSAGTVIGVAGALLGLALTVPAGSRVFLVISSALIVAVTVVLVGLVALQPIAQTPRNAIESVAEGDRLAFARDYARALVEYGNAIRLDPDYATAYVRRANLAMIQASPESRTSSFVVTSTALEARTSAIADLDHALALQPDNYTALVNQGANYFHVPDYGKSGELSRRAIDLNGSQPLPWMNLGLALVGQARESDARRAFDTAIRLIRQRPLAQERGELFAAARGTLDKAAQQTPSSAALVRSLKGKVTQAEAALVLPNALNAPQARVPSLSLASTGSSLRVDMEYDGLPTGAGLAWIVYYRPSLGREWVQRRDLSFYETSTLPASGKAIKQLFDSDCPIGGDYRLELFTEDRQLATAEVHQGSEDPPARAGAWDQLTPNYEVVGRFRSCIPPTWTYDSKVTGTMDAESPDGQKRIQIRTVPLPSPPASQEAREEVIDEVLDRLTASVDGTAAREDRPVAFPPVSGRARNLRLPNQKFALVWASIGDDGWLRTLSVTYLDQDSDGIDNLLGRLAFY